MLIPMVSVLEIQGTGHLEAASQIGLLHNSRQQTKANNRVASVHGKLSPLLTYLVSSPEPMHGSEVLFASSSSRTPDTPAISLL